MLQSKLFLKIQKEFPKDETAANARFLIRAGFIDKLMAGVYTYLPLGLIVLKKMENIVREEMLKSGGQELLMPALQPKENWLKTGRWDDYDTLFRFVSHYSRTELVLGPTHEEIISPLTKKFNLSYRDLPFYLFQIQKKFRDEKRVKSGLLRGREFLMKDFYSFHADEDDLNSFYEKMKIHYGDIFRKCGLGEKTFLTFASGGTFSRYSHEFQTLTEAGEDEIFLCEKCRLAVNGEIIREQSQCPRCGAENLIVKKAVETGNIFLLKTKYSRPFDLQFVKKDGSKSDVLMGCYGIGLDRLLGAVVEVNHDDKGIVWPEAVAPFQAHLLLLSESSRVKKEAEKVYRKLICGGIETLYDDREKISAGEKFAGADFVGIPCRLVVSEKTLAKNKIEIKKRNSEKTEFLTLKQVIENVKRKEQGEKQQSKMLK